MKYSRVIPRDLFNEGNLLKCYGRLYINLEYLGLNELLWHDGNAFQIEQGPSGELTLANVKLIVRGTPCLIWRPLNARDPYPLYLADIEYDEEIEIFDITGEFSPQMIDYLQR